MNKIEDVLYADNVAQDPSLLAKKRSTSSRVATNDETAGHSPGQTPTESMTLSDFMGWSVDQEETTTANEGSSPKQEDTENEKYQSYSARILARTKNSYMEKLYGLRSPSNRH